MHVNVGMLNVRDTLHKSCYMYFNCKLCARQITISIDIFSFKCEPHKMVKHTQTIADELLEFVDVWHYLIFLLKKCHGKLTSNSDCSLFYDWQSLQWYWKSVLNAIILKIYYSHGHNQSLEQVMILTILYR